MVKLATIVLACCVLAACATIAEKSVDFAIKHCWTHSGFSRARDCK